MTDQANTPTVPALDAWYFGFLGKMAMAMDPRPRLKRFALHDGARRMLAPKTERAALNLKIIHGQKENSK